MKATRLPHLRTLHRFELAIGWPSDTAVRIILRPRGFNSRLCTVVIEGGHEDNASDIREFFRAVEALADTPPPTPQRRKRRAAR